MDSAWEWWGLGEQLLNLQRYIKVGTYRVLPEWRVTIFKQDGTDWETLIGREHYGLTGHKDDPNRPTVPSLSVISLP